MNIFYHLVCRKRTLLLLGLLFFIYSATCSGQSNFVLEPSIGYGTFRMQGMKAFQRNLIQQVPVGVHITDEFPAFYIFGLRGAKALKDNLHVGFILETGSTGGRASYADYSGQLNFDQLMHYYSGGIYVEKKVYQNAFNFFYGLEAHALLNTFALKSYVQINNEEETDLEEFESIGGALKPYLGIAYAVKKLEFGTRLGYLIDINKPFHVKGQPEAVVIQDNSGKYLTPNWQGFRLNLFVRYYLHI